MTTDDFTDAARAEAEKRADLTAEPGEFEHGLIVKDFMAGAEWARAHLAAQEPTEDEVYAVRLVTHGALSPTAARAALSAARKASKNGG